MWLRTLLLVSAIGLLCAAGYRAVRLAVAEHLYRSNRRVAVHEAIRLEPRRAIYYAGLAELLETADGDARGAWRTAVALSPNNSDLRIRLGLQAEAAGDYHEAEYQLLAAAHLSRKFEPRWTLANYYYRRGRKEKFWRWAAEASAMSYGNRTPLFDLCWAMEPAADVILRRVASSRRAVLRDFAMFLVRKREWSTAASVLTGLAGKATGPERRYFLGAMDQLLRQSRVSPAVSIWNSLCRRGVLGYACLNPETGPVLTNRTFSKPVLNHAFGWRLPRVAGVFVFETSGSGLRISLSGDQPERGELLWRYMPLEAGRRYELSYQYRSRRSPTATGVTSSGIRWKIAWLDSKVPIHPESSILVPDGAGEGRTRFRVPAGVAGARLVLVHQRAPGSTRMEGSITMMRVEVTPSGRVQAQ